MTADSAAGPSLRSGFWSFAAWSSAERLLRPGTAHKRRRQPERQWEEKEQLGYRKQYCRYVAVSLCLDTSRYRCAVWRGGVIDRVGSSVFGSEYPASMEFRLWTVLRREHKARVVPRIRAMHRPSSRPVARIPVDSHQVAGRITHLSAPARFSPGLRARSSQSRCGRRPRQRRATCRTTRRSRQSRRPGTAPTSTGGNFRR